MNDYERMAEAEIARRRAFEPLRFFHPNKAQVRFIDAFKEKDSRIILFPAGNWIGKTASAIAILGACIWPDQAEDEIFNHPLVKSWTSFGYPKRARILSTPKELEAIGSIQVEIKRWWPVGRYKADSERFPRRYTTDTGWVIDLMSYEQDLSEFEGATIPFFVFNEPSKEAIFDACLSRMKFGGKVLMPMTPLADSAWIWDRLIAKEGQQGIRVIYGDTMDNCIDNGGVIPREAIENFANSCDPDEREARLHGKFLHLSGAIFKGFDRNVHTAEGNPPGLDGREIYMVCDPAVGKPLAVIWASVGQAGDIFIFDESPNYEFNKAKDPNFGVKEYVELFKTKEAILGGRPVNRILDRHFGNQRRTLGGLTLKQEFANFNFNFADSYSISDVTAEVETGILKMKDALRYDKTKPLDSINRPKLTISANCINTIHALERWSRDPKNGKPKEEYKDFADVVRYLVMSNPEVRKPSNYKPEVLSYGVNAGLPVRPTRHADPFEE